MIFLINNIPDDCLQVLGLVDSLRTELRYVTQEPRRWSGLLRRSTFARAIQGSNSIEGYNVTIEDAVAAVEGEEPFDAQSEPWAAVLGYRQALTYILQLTDDPHFRYSNDLLRGLHYMMLAYDLTKHPGRWRPGHIYVRHEPTGQIVYEGPDSGTVPSFMDELIDSLNSDSSQPAILRAAMGHLNLVMIHPFSDGNGRMARALQTLVLARVGILAPPFSSIEEYLGRNTQEYYSVLAEVGQGRWNPHRDATPWLRFCLTAHYRQAETLLRRTKELRQIWDELEIELQRRGLPERMLFALADAAMGWRIRNSTYRKAAEISENLSSRDLKILVDNGLLVPVGEKRGRAYVAGEMVKSIRVQARQPRPVGDPFAAQQQTIPGLEM